MLAIKATKQVSKGWNQSKRYSHINYPFMTHNPFVTLVTPSHNTGTYLRKTPPYVIFANSLDQNLQEFSEALVQ